MPRVRSGESTGELYETCAGVWACFGVPCGVLAAYNGLLGGPLLRPHMPRAARPPRFEPHLAGVLEAGH